MDRCSSPSWPTRSFLRWRAPSMRNRGPAPVRTDVPSCSARAGLSARSGARPLARSSAARSRSPPARPRSRSRRPRAAPLAFSDEREQSRNEVEAPRVRRRHLARLLAGTFGSPAPAAERVVAPRADGVRVRAALEEDRPVAAAADGALPPPEPSRRPRHRRTSIHGVAGPRALPVPPHYASARRVARSGCPRSFGSRTLSDPDRRDPCWAVRERRPGQIAPVARAFRVVNRRIP